MIRTLDDGVLLAVIDGLGHGPEAERAAVLAADVLTSRPPDGAVAMMDAVHRALRGTRGAALTLALARGATLSVLGVGNVAIRVIGPKQFAPRPAPGIVGYSLPRGLRPFDIALTAPARVVITSDGVSERVDPQALESLTPERACDRLIEHHSVAHDDATALVADLVPRAR